MTQITVADMAKLLIVEAREQLELNDKQMAVIEAAKGVPGEIKSILESLAFAPPENYQLHYERLAELGNDLHALLEALAATEGRE